jgi:hypothetical protein
MNASPVRKSPIYFSKPVKIIATLFIGLYLVIWAISSPLSKYFINPILAEQGLMLSSDTSIRYNPFLSQLTVSDLTLYLNKQEKVLSVDKFTIRLTLFRLLFEKIVISEFQLDNAYIKINKTATQLVIAGVDLNKENLNEKPKSNQKEIIVTESKPFNYQLLLPKIDFNQINIDIENNNKPHHVLISNLLITQVKANEQYQQANINLQSIIDGTELMLDADFDFEQGQGEISTQLSIIDYPIAKLQRYVEDLSELSGSFSLVSEQSISITTEQIKLHLTKAEITNRNLVVGYQQQFFTLEKLQQNISDLKLTLNQGEITELSGEGQLTLNKASAHYNKPSQKLAYFEQLSLNDMSFHFTGSPEIKITEFMVKDIFVSKNEDIDLPPIMKLKQFNINDIIINEHHLAVDQIILDSLQSQVTLNKEKAIANLVTMPITEKEEVIDTAEEVDQEINATATDFIISLNAFSLINDNQISMVDNSVDPVAKRKLFIDKLTLGALSNAKEKQDQQTPFELVGRSNKYAHFDFKGFTQPFSKQPEHYINGFLKELSLRSVSTYMKQAMQLELKNGQLDTDINLSLKGEQLDGNVVILLQGLETSIADSDEAGALIDQGALPFNIALGMLKDSSGNVELDVPLSGSTSDPQFGVSSVVSLITQKAIWMATQDYLLTTFVPYANIVSAAMAVGEFALKLRFDDLPYQAKQITINEAQQAYVKSFIALMQDKEDTRVNICAISTPADIDLKTGSKVTDKSKIKQLKDIAEQREEVFKEYIIKHGNIASSRLLLCSPKIDSGENAQPRIELSV